MQQGSKVERKSEEKGRGRRVGLAQFKNYSNHRPLALVMVIKNMWFRAT